MHSLKKLTNIALPRHDNRVFYISFHNHWNMTYMYLGLNYFGSCLQLNIYLSVCTNVFLLLPSKSKLTTIASNRHRNGKAFICSSGIYCHTFVFPLSVFNDWTILSVGSPFEPPIYLSFIEEFTFSPVFYPININDRKFRLYWTMKQKCVSLSLNYHNNRWSLKNHNNN